jgi:CRP-like cAMP-binding protein
MNKTRQVNRYCLIDFLVIKQDDVGDFMLILYEGKARVIVDGNEVAQKYPNDVMGEAALQTKQKRRATIVANIKCRCLVIYKDDYDNAVDLFK